MMKKFIVYKSCARMLAVLLLFTTATVQAAIEELPLSIASLDVVKNSVTLQGLEIPAREYRLAFDIEIRLLGGQSGTAGNLREGDWVTAIVDSATGVVHKLFVVGK